MIRSELEDNPQLTAMIHKLQLENKSLYASFEERYEKLTKEMESLKSFYNHELDREKSTISKLIEENKEQRYVLNMILLIVKSFDFSFAFRTSP